MKNKRQSRLFVAKSCASLTAIFVLASTASAQNAADIAKQYLNARYSYGGNNPSTGIDCSRLTQLAYQGLFQELPRTSQQQFSQGEPVSRNLLQPGDLVFFRTTSSSAVTHVGIFSGGSSFINANSVAGKVQYDSLNSSYWSPRFAGARRVTRKFYPGCRILLRPWRNGQPTYRYVMAYDGGGRTVSASSPNPWSWETWKAIVNESPYLHHGMHVGLRTVDRNLYLSDDGGSRPAKADRVNCFGWEWWLLEREFGAGIVRNGDRISLKGWNGKHLSANYNYGDVTVGAFYPFGGWGGWETFTIIIL